MSNQQLAQELKEISRNNYRLARELQEREARKPRKARKLNYPNCFLALNLVLGVAFILTNAIAKFSFLYR